MSFLQMSGSQSSFFLRLLVGLSISCFILSAEAVAENRDADQRSIGDYRRDVKTFMKLSKSEDEQTQRNAVFNLCALHHELVNDSRFSTNSQVQSFRVVVANRLKGFSKQLTKEFKKQESATSSRARKSQAKIRNEKSVPESEEDSQTQADATGGEEDQAVFQSALQSYNLLTQLSGGPTQVFDYAGGRMGAPQDNGQQLVDLIQNTIDPASWRDNGGNAAIHYYQPGRVLVINGSQRIHELTEDLLWKLRANF